MNIANQEIIWRFYTTISKFGIFSQNVSLKMLWFRLWEKKIGRRKEMSRNFYSSKNLLHKIFYFNCKNIMDAYQAFKRDIKTSIITPPPLPLSPQNTTFLSDWLWKKTLIIYVYRHLDRFLDPSGNSDLSLIQILCFCNTVI